MELYIFREETKLLSKLQRNRTIFFLQQVDNIYEGLGSRSPNYKVSLNNV